MKTCINTAVLTMGAATMLAIPATSLAQERQAAVLEEVVVTATRREQSLQEVPLAVTAMSADQLAVQGVNSLADIQPGTIPGVLFTTFTGTPSVLQPSIRGVGTADATQGTVEMPVPVYIDGVFLGRAQGLGLELIDPERVEVLRGPQGQLFGRNAEGGAIQFVSRKPSGEFGVRTSASFGNYNDRRYRMAVDLPEIAGFSATISGMSSKHDPYTKMAREPLPGYQPPGPHTGYGMLDSEGYRIAVRWESEDGGVRANYSYDDSETTDSQGYTTWIPEHNLLPPVALPPPSSDFPDRTFDRQYNLPFDVEASGHMLTLEWDVSDTITLKSISSSRDSGRAGGTNLAGSLPAAGVGLYPVAMETVDAEQVSQEFQLIGSWERFDLTAGAIYYNEDVMDHRRSLLTGPDALPAFGADPALVSDNLQYAETDSYGAYIQGGYRPAAFEDRLELILGLRYSDDSKEARRVFDLAAGGPVNQVAKFDEERVDPAFTVSYQWTDDINTYLRYATGYRAGGANVRSSSFTSFGEETTETWEVGLKSQFSGGVQLNAALFHNTVKDEQLTIQEQPVDNPSLTNTINSPVDKKVKGVELELLWRAMAGLDLGLNFAYLDVDEYKDLVNPFDPSGGTVERFWAVHAPETSGSVYGDYEYPLAVGYLKLHASYAWSDDHHGTPGAIHTAILPPGYDRPRQNSEQVAATLGWMGIPVGGGWLDVSLWGKNLTDDNAITYGFPGCASGGGFCTNRTAPRTYGVKFNFEY